jgi:hypothetical protein
LVLFSLPLQCWLFTQGLPLSAAEPSGAASDVAMEGTSTDMDATSGESCKQVLHMQVEMQQLVVHTWIEEAFVTMVRRAKEVKEAERDTVERIHALFHAPQSSAVPKQSVS